MNLLKKLAGQTAIYGVSSILGRLLTYALVPLYTRVFVPDQYGIVVELYSWVAILNILFTFGMETTYFRFTTRTKEEKPYHLASTSVIGVSLLLFAVLFLYSTDIAIWLKIPSRAYLVKWVAAILFMDAVVAIPFARLRIENRPKVFAAIKLGSIFVQVGLQVFFLWFVPQVMKGELFPFLQPAVSWTVIEGWSVEYVIFANLLSSAFTLVMLIPLLLKIRILFDWAYYKPMLYYGIPVLLTGLAGMLNDRLGIIIFEHRLPKGFYTEHTTKGALGIYGASEKLSVFMMLAIQAFRYAGEPFFFSQAEDKNAPKLFAQIMHYFVALCAIILVGVSLNAELIGEVFLGKKAFKEALYLVPVLLTARLFFGVYVNLSVWFKLTDRTYFGTIITGLGTLITALINFLLIPYIGYDAIAFGTIACFFVMAVLCYWTGRKYFPIPYELKSLFIYIVSAILLIVLARYVSFENVWLDRSLMIGFTFIYVLIIFLVEKNRINNKTV